MKLLSVIQQVRTALRENAYPNEAAITFSVVTPILMALGWDNADPRQLQPEYRAGRGRADLALIGLGQRPAVFIEVKQPGLAVGADPQLFAYAHEEGVPMCVLTDGREWSFYLPADQGTREERRVYLLQLDEREPEVSAEILTRYLARDRVRDGSALDDARSEHRQAVRDREAVANIPAAWRSLVTQADERLTEAVAEQAEQLGGFRPSAAEVVAYLRSLGPRVMERAKSASSGRSSPPAKPTAAPLSEVPALDEPAHEADDLSVKYTLLGQEHGSPNASYAMRDILSALAARDPDRLPALAEAVRTPTYNYVANRLQDIAPHNPQLCKGLEFANGWFVGTHMSNKRKSAVIRAAIRVFELDPADLSISLRNG